MRIHGRGRVMKYFLFFFLITFYFPLLSFASEIAVIDANYLMNESLAAKSLKQELKDKREAYKASHQSVETSFREREAALVMDQGTLSDVELKK